MASGDPMIFETLYNGDSATGSNYDSLLVNGPLEDWANTAAAADGWTWDETQVSTLARTAGARTSGVGSYFQKITINAPAQSLIGGYLQRVTLNGNEGYDAAGHLGASITVSIWARDTGAGDATINLRLAEMNAAGTILASTSGGATTLTGTWTQYTVTRTISEAGTRKLEINAILTSTSAGSAIIDLDEAEMYESYTTARLPSAPDDQIIAVPYRTFRRVLSGSLLRSRPAGPVAKIEKTLNYSMIGQAQYDAFLSLWLMDSPILWTPNHPHLPDTLIVRWVNDFNFRVMGPFASGPLYRGTMVLSEV